MAANPDLILADEPTGNLDSHSGAVILEVLNHIHSEFQTTLVLVTHSADVGKSAQRIIQMKDGKISVSK